MSGVRLVRAANWVFGFGCLCVLMFYGPVLNWYRVPLAGLAIGSLAIDALLLGERKRAIVMAVSALVVALAEVPPSVFFKEPVTIPSHVMNVG